MKFSFTLIASLIVLLICSCPYYVDSVNTCLTTNDPYLDTALCEQSCKKQNCRIGYCQWQTIGQRAVNVCVCGICPSGR